MAEARMVVISVARSPGESREGQGSSMDFMTASGNETAMDGGPDRPKRIAKEGNEPHQWRPTNTTTGANIRGDGATVKPFLDSIAPTKQALIPH